MKLIRLLASPRLMYVLAAVYASAMAIATFIENEHGMAASRRYIYYAGWFILLQALQAANLIALFVNGSYLKRISKGSLLFHGAFLLMWIGAAFTHYTGKTGMMHIREGETVDWMLSDEGDGKQTLPFTVGLEDFRLKRYPGSQSPMSYESDLTIGKAGEPSRRETVRMNKVVDVDGYRLFQSSFDTDEQGTVLSVSYDRPGMQLTYAGYFLLLVGFLWVLFDRRSRFGRMRAELQNIRKKTLVVLLLLSGGMTVQATEALPVSVPERHAELFGRLVVLNPNGRLEPADSFTSSVLRKLYGNDHIQAVNADQFFLNLLAFPDEWTAYPFIKVDNKELSARFKGVDGYVAWQSMFDAEGNYLLSNEVNALYAKPASERNRLDNDLLKLDESVNIVYRILQGQLLPLFPDENDASGRWYSAGDDLGVFHGKDSLFVSKIMEWYVYELQEAKRTGNWDEADKIVDMISTYQQAKHKATVIDQRKITAELLYNRLDLFFWCRLAYLILGGCLLLLACAEVVGNRSKKAVWSKLTVGLLGLAFTVHLGGLALRWYICGHVPCSNSYESMICTACILTGSSLLFARSYRILLSLAAILGGIMLFVAGLNHLNPEITPLVPVLQSYWLMSHVTAIMVGYVFFALCALTGLFNLLLMSLLTDANRERLKPRIRELTLLNEMAMTVGLFFMTAGTFIGAVWANVSWGRYWGWDPKETWALISIVVYALVLHLRFLPLLKRRQSWWFNLFSVVSILSVLMTWFGVNYYLSGLHSYGKTEGDLMLWTWIAGTIVVVLLALAARRKSE